MRIFKAERYQPTQEELEKYMKEKQIHNFSVDALADIAAYDQGEQFRNLSELEKELRKEMPEDFPKDRDGDYHLESSSSRYTKSLKTKQADWLRTELKKATAFGDFVQNVPLDKVPGKSPLDKASNLVKYLSSNRKKGSLNGIKDAEEVLEFLKNLENLDDLDKKFAGGDNITEIFTSSDKIAKHLFSIDQKLKQMSALGVKPELKLVKNRQGETKRYRSSRGIEDLPKANNRILLQRRNIAFQLISGKGRVSEKYTREKAMPFITMILDQSGSMGGEKAAKGLGVLYHLCKEVEAGNTLGLFSFFEEKCFEFVYLHPEMKPLEWFKNVAMKTRFDKGDTHVGRCAIQALDEFEKLVKEKNLPISSKKKHLILVNDGQDELGNFSYESLNGAVLHSFILQSKNLRLKEISVRSGGQYLEKL